MDQESLRRAQLPVPLDDSLDASAALGDQSRPPSAGPSRGQSECKAEQLHETPDHSYSLPEPLDHSTSLPGAPSTAPPDQPEQLPHSAEVLLPTLAVQRRQPDPESRLCRVELLEQQGRPLLGQPGVRMQGGLVPASRGPAEPAAAAKTINSEGSISSLPPVDGAESQAKRSRSDPAGQQPQHGEAPSSVQDERTAYILALERRNEKLRLEVARLREILRACARQGHVSQEAIQALRASDTGHDPDTGPDKEGSPDGGKQ